MGSDTIVLIDLYGEERYFEVGQLYAQFIDRGNLILGLDFKGILELRKAMLKAAIPQPFTRDRIIEFLKPLAPQEWLRAENKQLLAQIKTLKEIVKNWEEGI